MNFIPSEITDREGELCIRFMTNADKEYYLPISKNKDAMKHYVGKSVIAGLRPEHLSCGLVAESVTSDISHVECKINVTEPTGPDTLLFVNINGIEVTSRVRPDEAKPPGEIKKLDINMSKVLFFDMETQERIA